MVLCRWLVDKVRDKVRYCKTKNARARVVFSVVSMIMQHLGAEFGKNGQCKVNHESCLVG